MKTAIFGGGCFWCTEAIFQQLRGVEKVESGYAGGSVANPSYERVSSGSTGHAEVIRVTYDPAVISYDELLTVFFGTHDPTTPNRQGADVGEQYRSIILYQDESEKTTAEARIKELQAEIKDGTRVVTQVVPLDTFYTAEEYHQNYFNENKSAPYCQIIIEPKIEKLKARYNKLLKENQKTS